MLLLQGLKKCANMIVIFFGLRFVFLGCCVMAIFSFIAKYLFLLKIPVSSFLCSFCFLVVEGSSTLWFVVQKERMLYYIVSRRHSRGRGAFGSHGSVLVCNARGPGSIPADGDGFFNCLSQSALKPRGGCIVALQKCRLRKFS